jgi:DNA polymerase elongation subunit (family B)
MWLPFPEPFGDDKEMLRKAFEKGKKACEDIKREIFKKAFNDTHIDLEFEAVFFPYLLVGKKNYSAAVYDDQFGVEKPKKILTKGFRCVRRDVDAFTRNAQIEVLKHVHDRDVLAVNKAAVEKVRELLFGRVKASELSLSKKINSKYTAYIEPTSGEAKIKVRITPHGKWEASEGSLRGYCKVVAGTRWDVFKEGQLKPFGKLTLSQPHVHVMHRVNERRPGGGPKVGDRVPYVFIKNEKAKLQIEQAEDPDYVEENAVPIDTLYYFNHGLRNALAHILDVIEPQSYNRLMQAIHLKAQNVRKGQKEITQFFVKKRKIV